MVVRSIGNSLLVVLPDLVGKKITNWFDLVRPLIAFKFQTVNTTLSHVSGSLIICILSLQILNRTNNIFELVTVEPVPEKADEHTKRDLIIHEDQNDEEKNLRLKGKLMA